MTATEFATYLVPVGPESLALAEGFIVVCAAFYEWPRVALLDSFGDSAYGSLRDSV
jgi:hypothetical protein